MIWSIVLVVPKNTIGAKDFLFIPTRIANNAPATENTQVPRALETKQSSRCLTLSWPSILVNLPVPVPEREVLNAKTKREIHAMTRQEAKKKRQENRNRGWVHTKLVRCLSPLTAEASAALLAVTMAKHYRHPYVIIEGDSANAIAALKKEASFWEIDRIVTEMGTSIQ
ncbi:hypothetical protein F8388_013134 [Cannabis sativa]|uniref:Uncharacterized protein n=1 Tax=Cannabis sativa TaxID=3483 RepID=A0A7J6HLW3_CANSA|nr:hypothetical protein F8388_013134 [Cannabis sativa]